MNVAKNICERKYNWYRHATSYDIFTLTLACNSHTFYPFKHNYREYDIYYITVVMCPIIPIFIYLRSYNILERQNCQG